MSIGSRPSLPASLRAGSHRPQHRHLRRGDVRPGRSLADDAGLVLVGQKLGSAKGAMFLTVEDETGLANVVVLANLIRTPPAYRTRIQHDGDQ